MYWPHPVEDAIVFSTDSDYAANIEKAEAVAPAGDRSSTFLKKWRRWPHQSNGTIEAVATFLNVDASRCAKTLLVKAEEDDNGHSGLIALILRGDHTLNEIKAENLPDVAEPLTMATDEEIEQVVGCKAGSIGPVNLPVPVIVDRSAAHMVDFVCGANKEGHHLIGVNWERDVALSRVEDLARCGRGRSQPGRPRAPWKSGAVLKLATFSSWAINTARP